MKKLLLLILFFTQIGFSQKYNFINFSSDQGLESAQIFSIVQHTNGELYLATSGSGIAIFNGKNFKYLNVSGGLAGNSVTELFIDSKNNIWAATNNGLSKISNNKIKNFKASDGLTSNEIKSIFETSDNEIYIGASKGLSIIKDNKVYFNPQFSELKNSSVLSITEDKNKKIWIASRKGLFYFDGNHLKRYEKLNLKNTWPTQVFYDNSNNLWVSTTKQIYQIDNDKIIKEIVLDKNINEIFINHLTEDENQNLAVSTDYGVYKVLPDQILHFDRDNGLADNLTHTVFYDNENNIWIATDLGVTKFRHPNVQIFSSPSYLKDIWAIGSDNKNNLLLGIENNSIKSFKNGVIHNYLNLKPFADKSFWNIFKDSKNNLWMGTSKSLLKKSGKKITIYNKDNKFVNDEINVIYEDSKGNLIIGCYWTGVYFYDGKNFKNYNEKDGLKYPSVYSVIEDKFGNYWFGTDTGISFFDGNNFNNLIGKEYLEGYSIVDIVKDSRDNLWFATYGNGLIHGRLNSETNTYNFQKIGMPDGLNDKSVVFLNIHKNNLYIGTNKGLNKLDLDKFYDGNLHIISYSKKSDGILGIECIQNASYIDNNDNLWYGTIEGLVKLNLNLFTPLDKAPKIFFDNVEVFFQPINQLEYSYDGSIKTDSSSITEFNYDENHLTFSYSGISLTKGRDLKYTYKLVGLEKDWSPLTDLDRITYSSLKPGKYEFKVKAFINNNLSSEEISYTFIIEKPLWAKKWFLFLLMTSILLLLYFTYKKRISRIEKQNQLLSQQIEERKIYEKKIKQSEKNLFTILELLPAGVIMVNDQKEIVKINLTGKNILEINSDEQILGKSCKDYFSIIDNESNPEFKLEENSSIIEGKLITDQKKEKHLLISVVPIEINNESLLLQLFIDNSAHKKAELALFESEKRFRGFIENATIGIYRTTFAGKIIMQNSALTEMLGYDEEEIKEINTNDIYFDSKRRDVFLKTLQSQSGLRGFEELWKRKDGSFIYIRESARAVKDAENNILYIEGIVEDVSKIKVYEKELISAREKAEYSERLKTEFLAQMSHEIRTPINSILSYTALLKSDIAHLVPEEYLFTFDMINNGGRRLIRTIDSILNMSELQIGSYEYKQEVFNLDEVLIQLVNEAKIKAESKGLELIFSNVGKENISINADNYSTIQLFDNLIDNAIKYTNSGSVKVELLPVENKNLLVCIKDTGIGIDEDFLPHLFSAFSQEEQGYKRKFEGNGLGLALVKRYAELNNFELKVESVKNEGTTFFVKIPVTN